MQNFFVHIKLFSTTYDDDDIECYINEMIAIGRVVMLASSHPQSSIGLEEPQRYITKASSYLNLFHCHKLFLR
jgi:hypothetical protein